MISRPHRFHGHAALPAVYRQGRAVHGLVMSLKYVARYPDQPYRLAVVVSKKVHKSAVKRNRIRRRLYEAMRLQEGDLLAQADLIVTVHSESLTTVPFTEVEQQLRKLLTSAGLLSNTGHDIVVQQESSK